MQQFLLSFLLGFLLTVFAPAQTPPAPPLTLPELQLIGVENAPQIASVGRLGQGVIADFAWSPDSRSLAVATTIGVWLRDANNPEADSTYWEMVDGARSVAFSPDGTTLAAGMENGALAVWDVEAETAVPGDAQHLYAVNHVAYSPDGVWLVSGDISGIVRVWDTATGEVIHVLNDIGSLNTLAFSDNGAILLAGGESAVKLWDTTTWELRAEFPGASSAYLIRDGSQLVTIGAGDQARTASIWEIDSGERVMKLEHESPILALDIHPDGQQIATGTASRIRLWNADTGEGELLSRRGGLVAFSPDGATLAYGEYPLTLYNLTSGEIQSETHYYVGDEALRYSPDGQQIASLGIGRLRVFSTQTNAPSSIIGSHNRPLTSLEFSFNGDLVAGEDSGLACVRHHDEGYAQRYCGGFGTLDAARSPIRDVAFHPTDALRFVWASESGWIRGDQAGYESSDLFTQHEGSANALLYARSAQTLITAGDDGLIRLHDTETLEQIDSYDVGAPVYALALDGNTSLTTGDALNRVQIWRLGRGDVRMTLEGHTAPVRALAFHPRGMALASGGDDSVIILWQISGNNGTELRRLYGHIRGVISIAFTPDGSILASGSLDGTVRLWDMNTGEPLATLDGHNGGITGVAFDSEGRLLASASYDGTIRLWGVPQQ